MVAPNPGPFTLDGSVSWVVGQRRLIVVDPGPDVDSHARALVAFCRGADEVRVALTHGHGDHAGGVDLFVSALREAAGLEVSALVGSGHPRAVPLREGERVPSDHGDLVCVPTPGHSRDHVAWHWPAAGALFSGDHILGHGDTTWVGEYSGCVADYLASLDRVRELELAVIHPGHGPDLTDPSAAVTRFEEHRRARIAQVRTLRRERPAAGLDDLFPAIYGDAVPPGLEGAARASLWALMEYVDTDG